MTPERWKEMKAEDSRYLTAVGPAKDRRELIVEVERLTQRERDYDELLRQFDKLNVEYAADKHRWSAAYTALEQQIKQLEAEIARLRSMSTVEMMCENENVRAHVTEWENRCLKAEAENAKLREALIVLMDEVEEEFPTANERPTVGWQKAKAALKAAP